MSDRRGDRRAHPGSSAAPPRRASSPSAIGVLGRGDHRGPRVRNAYSTLSLDAADDGGDDGALSMLDALGVDDEALEHVEIRESIKPLLEALAAAGEADPAAAVLPNMTQSQIADGDRRLARCTSPGC